MNQEREQTKPKFVQGDPLNRSKGGLTRREFLKKAGVAIAGAAAGIVLPDALTNKARADAPVVEAPPPDAPVEPVLTKRVFIPRALNQVTQAEIDAAEKPLWPDRFGEFAPYNFEIVNRGTKAGIIIGKQELYDNLVTRLREWGNAPEVPRRIVVYEDIAQLNRESQLPYEQFSFSPGNDLLGPMAWRSGKLPDGSLQLDVSIPTIKDPSRLEEWFLYAGNSVTSKVLKFIVTTDNSGNYREGDRWGHLASYRIYSNTYQPIYPIYEQDENNHTVAAPLLAKYKNL